MTVLALAPRSQVPDGTLVAAPDTDSVVAAVLDLGRSEDVLVLAVDRAGHDAARSARLVLGGDRIGVLPHPGPPTATFVAVAALRMLPPIALGLAPTVLDGLAEDTRTAVLLSSVSGLDRPRPSVALDLVSRLPGSVFRVDWSAQTVARERELDLPTGVAAVTTESQSPVVSSASTAWGSAHVALESDGSFWGARRWLEATVLLVPLEESVERRLTPSAVALAPRCTCCGRLVAGPLCLFCRIPAPAGTPTPHPGGHA